MSERGYIEFLNDIKEAIVRIRNYIEEMSYEEFLSDEKTQDAVVRNLEIIGEAAKNIPETVTEKYKQIPWDKMAKTRDRVIHHYFGVNYDIVWGIAEEELPRVSAQIEEILHQEQGKYD